MTGVKWLLAPKSPDLTRFITLAAVTVTLLLVCYHRLISTDLRLILYHRLNSTNRDNRTSSALSAEQRQRQNTTHVLTAYNYSFGLVWPNVDNVDARIMTQIDFTNAYAQQKRNRTLKLILRVGNFNFEEWVAGQKQFVRDRCPIVDCWNSNDQSKAREADALLISQFNRASLRFYLPKPPRQIWIAQLRESPLHNRIDPDSLRGLINWTVSYRRDSTVVLPYGWVLPNASNTASGEGSFNYSAGKTKLVAWFVTNCNAGNQRLRYAQELSKFIQV